MSGLRPDRAAQTYRAPSGAEGHLCSGVLLWVTPKNHLPRLRHYLEDGRIEIDNKQIENKIRLLALGRKNYMFAGSNQGAQRAAMMYSFFATCKEHGVNPRDWLRDVPVRIGNHPVNRLEELLPGEWRTNRERKGV